MHNEACMVEGKSYTFIENLYLCEQQIQVFSLLFTDNTFTNWFQLDSSTAMYSRGKISKGGELETTYESHHSKKLQDNPVSSETPV